MRKAHEPSLGRLRNLLEDPVHEVGLRLLDPEALEFGRDVVRLRGRGQGFGRARPRGTASGIARYEFAQQLMEGYLAAAWAAVHSTHLRPFSWLRDPSPWRRRHFIRCFQAGLHEPWPRCRRGPSAARHANALRAAPS